MSDLINLQYNGIPIIMYSMIALTTGVLSYVTLMGEDTGPESVPSPGTSPGPSSGPSPGPSPGTSPGAYQGGKRKKPKSRKLRQRPRA